MDKLHKDHQQQLQQISFNHTKKLLGGDMSVVFYDVTTLYFEAEREDDLRKMGFSKDGRAQNPQIVLGLLVSTGGYPLAYEMFEGNKFEGKTMMPVIEAFKQSYGLEKLVIIADAGLLSNDNIDQLSGGGYEFILGARIKNETETIKKQILLLGLRDGQSSIIEKSNGLKLIVSYAAARAGKDEYNRKRGLQKLESYLKTGKLSKKHINNRGYNKYLKLEGEITVAIDYDRYKQDAVWDGFKAYLTNTQLPKETIIEHYKNLWQIEKAFRISKTDLKVRPIYHRLARRIKSHLNIAFCSYKLYKELERQLKLKSLLLSPEKAIEVMKSIYSIKTILPASQKEASIIIVKEQEQKNLLDAFNIPC
jgi:transposase